VADQSSHDPLRSEAYRYLSRAVDEAGDELALQWWFDQDPDLQSLRDLRRPEWRVLAQRGSGRAPRPVGIPEAPWERFLRGLPAALVVAFALAALGAIVVLVTLPAIAVAAAVLIGVPIVQWARRYRRTSQLGRVIVRDTEDRDRSEGDAANRLARAATDMRRARQLVRAHDYAGAVQAWRRAEAGGRIDAAIEMGAMHERRGETRAAGAAYERARKQAGRDRDLLRLAERGLADLKRAETQRSDAAPRIR
jgi:hypothetical protein